MDGEGETELLSKRKAKGEKIVSDRQSLVKSQVSEDNRWETDVVDLKAFPTAHCMLVRGLQLLNLHLNPNQNGFLA